MSKYNDNDQFYSPSRKQQREMVERIRALLARNGFPGAFVVRGAHQPTLELSVPRGKKRRDGGQSYTTFCITTD